VLPVVLSQYTWLWLSLCLFPISAAITGCGLHLYVVACGDGSVGWGCCCSIPIPGCNQPGCQARISSCFEETLLCLPQVSRVCTSMWSVT
jgi:hypothetical protein